jgi:hypothetical protein
MLEPLATGPSQPTVDGISAELRSSYRTFARGTVSFSDIGRRTWKYAPEA